MAGGQADCVTKPDRTAYRTIRTARLNNAILNQETTPIYRGQLLKIHRINCYKLPEIFRETGKILVKQPKLLYFSDFVRAERYHVEWTALHKERFRLSCSPSVYSANLLCCYDWPDGEANKGQNQLCLPCLACLHCLSDKIISPHN